MNHKTKYLVSLEYDISEEEWKDKYDIDPSRHRKLIFPTWVDEYKNPDEVLAMIHDKYPSLGRTNVKMHWIKDVENYDDYKLYTKFIPFCQEP